MKTFDELIELADKLDLPIERSTYIHMKRAQKLLESKKAEDLLNKFKENVENGVVNTDEVETTNNETKKKSRYNLDFFLYYNFII